MNSWESAVSALHYRYLRWRYHNKVEEVRKTAPILPGVSPITVLSMLHPRDLLSYLVAVKSFHRFIPASRYVLVADPAMRTEHVALLLQHMPKLEVVSAEAFRHPDLPQGGCWERLAAICHFRKDGFVVQLDADTVARARLSEVEAAIGGRAPFLLSERDDLQIGTIEQAQDAAHRVLKSEDGVQWHCEANLSAFASLGITRYMRGCAAFCGFPKAPHALDLLTQMSRSMQERLGQRWVRWGTEQFASNVLVCNSENAVPLPHPKYCSPNAVTPDTVFIHFIGYLRFISGLYADETKRFVDSLSGGLGENMQAGPSASRKLRS